MKDAFVRSYKSNYNGRAPLYRLVLSIYFSTTDFVHDHCSRAVNIFFSIIKYVTMDFEIRFLCMGHITLSPYENCLNHELYRAKIPVAL